MTDTETVVERLVCHPRLPLVAGLDAVRPAVHVWDHASAQAPPCTGVPEDGDLEEHLVVTDGARAWEPDDLASVTTATTADPSWLQLQAAVNNAREQDR